MTLKGENCFTTECCKYSNKVLHLCKIRLESKLNTKQNATS